MVTGILGYRDTGNRIQGYRDSGYRIKGYRIYATGYRI